MTVAVIGGGAAGMMAALSAAERGHTVCLLERQARVGRKLSATGNGRCNLSNMGLSEHGYHGKNPAFVLPALECFGVKKTLEYFHKLGLLTTTEDSGKVYPLSDQAGSVVDVLRFAVEEAGVILKTGFEVMTLKKKKQQFILTSSEETLTADKVIVCCGGMAGGKLGGSGSGYELLKSMGHTVTPLYPALVQVKTEQTYVRSLKGVRADAEIILSAGKKQLAKNRGELQFTEFGVSGPVIFELSRWVSTAPQRENMVLHLNFLPEYSPEQIEVLLTARQKNMPHLTMENLLTGLLHNRLGRTVLRYAGYELASPISTLHPADLRIIAGAIRDFALPVQGTLGFQEAQVTAGGVRTDEFNPETLQSKLVPGLYAAGEVLDIDGDCGGYNLQWAWASGYLAGMTL